MMCGNPGGGNGEQSRIDRVEMGRRDNSENISRKKSQHQETMRKLYYHHLALNSPRKCLG